MADLVGNARMSVLCSTFNFPNTSGLWTALRTIAGRPEVSVRFYMDAAAAEGGDGTPTAVLAAAQLAPAAVFVSTTVEGKQTRNHAKFVLVDHRFLLVTSANFSWSADNRNVEFGVLLDDRSLTEAVEREMTRAENMLYRHVRGT